MSQGTSPLCSNGRAFAGGWVMSAGRHLPLHNQQPHPGPTAHRSRFAVDWNLSRALANVSARGGRVERNWYFNRDMLVDMPHMRRALELAIRMVCGAAKREAWCAGLPGHGSPADDTAPRTAMCCLPGCTGCATGLGLSGSTVATSRGQHTEHEVAGACGAVCPLGAVRSCAAPAAGCDDRCVRETIDAPCTKSSHVLSTGAFM